MTDPFESLRSTSERVDPRPAFRADVLSAVRRALDQAATDEAGVVPVDPNGSDSSGQVAVTPLSSGRRTSSRRRLALLAAAVLIALVGVGIRLAGDDETIVDVQPAVPTTDVTGTSITPEPTTTTEPATTLPPVPSVPSPFVALDALWPTMPRATLLETPQADPIPDCLPPLPAGPDLSATAALLKRSKPSIGERLVSTQWIARLSSGQQATDFLEALRSTTSCAGNPATLADTLAYDPVLRVVAGGDDWVAMVVQGSTNSTRSETIDLAAIQVVRSGRDLWIALDKSAYDVDRRDYAAIVPTVRTQLATLG